MNTAKATAAIPDWVADGPRQNNNKKGENMKTTNTSCCRTLTAVTAVAAVLSACGAVTVNSVSALQSEIANATNGKEIIIAAGTYNLADKTAMSTVGPGMAPTARMAASGFVPLESL